MADRGEIRPIEWAGSIEALSTFPVIVFAYTCHQNVRSQGSVNAVIFADILSRCSLF
jgi:hypothetical protein